MPNDCIELRLKSQLLGGSKRKTYKKIHFADDDAVDDDYQRAPDARIDEFDRSTHLSTSTVVAHTDHDKVR